MESFFASLVKFRLAVCLAFLLVFAAGWQCLSHIPIDAFPDLANNQVQILTETPGMAPSEAEQLVTIPIESIMSGLPGVDAVRSISKYGLSVVTVVFKDGVDTYFARQLVLERLQTAKARIPATLNPQLGPISTAMGEIYQYIVAGREASLTDLKTLQDWDLKYQLRTVAGVAEVNTWGGKTREFTVTVNPTRLQQFGLTMRELFAAIKANNENFGAGIIEHESEQMVVRGTGRVTSLADIENITIRTEKGVPILVKNVASVAYGEALRQGAATRDGQGEVVLGLVMMLKGENSRAVIERVKAKMAEMSRALPEGVALRPFYDQSRLVDQTIETVRTNLLEGGLLVVLVLLLTVGNLRAALIVALVIPMSMLFSFIGMKYMSVTANIMSLGAIDFGMIVDGSIVMAENTLRHLAEPAGGRDRLAVIAGAVKEVSRPILFGVLIITVVYMPILCLEGMEFKMFSPMVVTVCSALVGSLLISLVLVPVLLSFFITGAVTDRDSPLVRLLKKPYTSVLDFALAHRRLTVVAAFCILAIAAASVPFLGTEFVPRLDEGDILIETRNFPSISLAGAIKKAGEIETAVRQSPEVEHAVSRIGRPDLATDPMSVFASDTFVMLKPKSQWRKGLSKEDLADEIRARLANAVAGCHFNFTQPIAMRVDELVSGVRSDLAIKLFGDDLDYLQKKAREIESIVATVPGVTDLQVEKLSGSEQLLIVPDRARLARYGVSVDDVRTLAQTAIIGSEVSEVLEGRKRFALRVRFPHGMAIEPADVDRLLVESEGGLRIPLSQVAAVTEKEGMETINRESGQRRIVIQCNVRGRDIGGFVAEAQRKIAGRLALAPGYYITWGGQFENQQRAARKLELVVPLSILIIFIFLSATFGRIRHALIVILNVPFSAVGGIAALWLTGMYLSVSACVGFIALFGVAVLNGLVLIAHVNTLIASGAPLPAAVRDGALTRFRPVIMTAMVAALGFLPMALSQGAGAEVQRPLATVVIGGLVSSTILTLVVLPVVYLMVNRPRSPA